jgi:sec-independent protein translocase protein TatA
LEIGIVLVIALIVFGPKRLPELGSGLGRGMREFKETITGEKKGEETRKEDEEVKVLSAATTPVGAGERSSAAAENA